MAIYDRAIVKAEIEDEMLILTDDLEVEERYFGRRLPGALKELHCKFYTNEFISKVTDKRFIEENAEYLFNDDDNKRLQYHSVIHAIVREKVKEQEESYKKMFIASDFEGSLF